MRDVPEFRDGPTAFIEPRGSLDFFARKYITNLKQHCDISTACLLDCGCGHGWNTLAYMLEGGHQAVGLDLNEIALRAARQFSQILGFEKRVTFCHGSVTEIPLPDKSVDLVCCVETLEHLHGQADLSLRELNRVAKSVILVTTPNSLFPVIAHDTRLPGAHWLPPNWRQPYARLFGRQRKDDKNVFVSPFQIVRGLKDFKLASKFLGFPSFEDFKHCYPHYLPYMGEGISGARNLGAMKKWFYAANYALFGAKSFYTLPSLTGVFTKK